MLFAICAHATAAPRSTATDRASKEVAGFIFFRSSWFLSEGVRWVVWVEGGGR